MNKFWCVMAIAMVGVYAPSSFAIDQTKRTFNITTDAIARSFNFTSDTTTTTRDRFKVVQAAKSDAATYVASDGKVQGPYLTKAFAVIRDELPATAKMSDLELAQAVLAVK